MQSLTIPYGDHNPSGYHADRILAALQGNVFITDVHDIREIGSMTLVVVDQGEEAFLDLILAANYTLRLFKNDATNGLTTAQIDALDESDFTEATFTGYSAKNLTGGSWTTTAVAQDRLAALENLAHLHRVGNDLVRAEVIDQTRRLLHDDNKIVSAAAMKLITTLNPEQTRRQTEEQTRRHAEAPRWIPPVSSNPRRTLAEEHNDRPVVASPTLPPAADGTTARSDQLAPLGR